MASGVAQPGEAPGGPVSVSLHSVRADKREQFEHFVHRVLHPAAGRVRLLRPAAANVDGTHTYVLLLDGAAGPDGQIDRLLARAYGAEQGRLFGRLYREALAGPQVRCELAPPPAEPAAAGMGPPAA